jgi:hypothetical protein
VSETKVSNKETLRQVSLDYEPGEFKWFSQRDLLIINQKIFKKKKKCQTLASHRQSSPSLLSMSSTIF